MNNLAHILLVNGALSWISDLEKLQAKYASVSPIDIVVQLVNNDNDAFIEMMVEQQRVAYSIVTAIQQIYEHGKQLRLREEDDAFQKVFEEFSREYDQPKIRSLRNILEHHAEYLIGEGKKQDLVKNRGQGISVGGDGRGNLSTIGIFGASFDVSKVVPSAVKLKDSLLKLKANLVAAHQRESESN